MRLNDAVIGMILLFFGGAVIFHAQTSFPGLPGQNYGPAFFPTIIGTGLGLCGLLFVAQGLAQRATVPWITFGDWVSSVPHRRNLVAVLAALLFYILCSDFLGFFITSTILLTALLVLFGNRITVALAVAIVATVVIHLFFYKLLLVPLPWGLLEPFAW